MSRALTLVIAACAALLLTAPQARADEEAAARAERWSQLQGVLFPNRKVLDGAGVVELEAPPRAMDAALVPLAIALPGEKQIKSVSLVIDNNPGPLAARFAFGPAADASTLKMRMRVNSYTNIHAVAEDAQGQLYAVEKFVKASGGCSAPAGPNNEESLSSVGQMRFKLLGEFAPGQPVQAQLMIRHPNFNGMQMDQITRMYTPAHFIKTIDVSYEGERVFHMDTDISLSTDPVLTFGFVPKAPGQLKVEIKDSKDQTFVREFDVPAAERLSERN